MFSYYIFLFVFANLPFLFSFNGDFVFDDSEAVVKNKDVYGDDWTETFIHDFWGENIQSNLSHKSYRPLSILSFRLNYFLSGRKLVATHFKITNLICHSICCLVIYLALHELLDTRKSNEKFWSNKAYLSALLFSIHPIHVECVSGIVGRADILAAILYFLALLVYWKARHSSSTTTLIMNFLCTVLLSGVSMLCKENGVTVLGICILYEFANMVKRTKNVDVKPSITRIALLIISVLCLLYARWLIMGQSKPQFKSIDNPAAFADHFFTKVMTYTYIYFMNAVLLIWPHWLCFDWSMGCVPLIEGLDYRLLFVLLLFAYGLLVLKILSSRRNDSTKRHIFLAVSLMVAPFLPAANIFYPVGFVVAERILYIPSAGFCLLIVIGLSKIINRRRWRKIGQFLYCLLLITFMLKCWKRSSEWRDEYSLFTSALSVCPLNAKVHYNVAKVADARQQTDWALEEYREAISQMHNDFRLYPEYYQAMNNLANLLKNHKQYAEAELYLQKAISLKVDFPAAWMNLGIVLANTKRYDESLNAYQMAIKYRNNYPDCYYNLGNLNLEMNSTQNALDNWFEAIRLNPKHNLAWTNLLALLDNSGQLSKASEVIPIALAELSDSPSVNFAIANIYGKMERYELAEKHFLRAIKLFENNVRPIQYSNLGVLYHRWKKYKLAKKMYENALQIDPNFRSALQNLRSVQKYIK